MTCLERYGHWVLLQIVSGGEGLILFIASTFDYLYHAFLL